MQCRQCQRENPAEARFCLHCGAAQSLRCGSCDRELPAEARFCMGCGQPVGAGIFAATACAAAVGVVASRNVVRMAFWLIVSLGATAGLFFALNADFVGATQLLVYVGGTLVLLRRKNVI